MKYKFEHQIQCERFPVQSKDVRRFIFSLYGELAPRTVMGEELLTLLRMDEAANLWVAEHLAIANNSRADFYEKSFPAGVLKFAAAQEDVCPIQATAQGGRVYPPERGLRAALGFAAGVGAPRLKPAVGRQLGREGDT